MKKSLKIFLAVVLMLATLIVLTGCGNKAENSDTKNSAPVPNANTTDNSSNFTGLIATKTTEEDFNAGEDSTITYEEKLEISFNGDSIDKVNATFTFESAELASAYVEEYNSMIDFLAEYAEEEEETFNFPKLTLNGKTASMVLSSEEYVEMFTFEEENLTKDSLKAQLENEGYKVTVK